MSKVAWIIIFVTALIIFIASLVLLIVRKDLKNRYVKPYVTDEFVKKADKANCKSDLYFTKGETSNYIEKYVVSRSEYEKYVICKYREKYETIQFFVVSYNAHKKVISVLRYTEKCNGSSSKIIALPKHCSHVNIIVSKVNDQDINEYVFLPISKKRVLIYSLLVGLLTMSASVVLDLAIGFIISGSYYIMVYLNSGLHYLMMIICVAIGLICFLCNFASLSIKNRKSMTGGVVEYEFIQ